MVAMVLSTFGHAECFLRRTRPWKHAGLAKWHPSQKIVAASAERLASEERRNDDDEGLGEKWERMSTSGGTGEPDMVRRPAAMKGEIVTGTLKGKERRMV